jgi:hypothetical protein
MIVKKARFRTTKKEVAQKILSKVPQYSAFYFFRGIGQYDGKFATSLIDFNHKVKTINIKSVDFHFKRRDFENWIRTTVEDTYLADKIPKINKSVKGEELLTQMCQMIEKRLTELKKLLASEEHYVEHDDDL